MWIASGLKPEWLSPVERSRLKRRLGHSELKSIVRMLRKRSEVHYLRADEGDVWEIAEEPIVLSGVSAAAKYVLDIRAPGAVEGYVRADDLDHLVRKYGLQRSNRHDSNDERTRRAGRQAAERLAR
jgi:hypothetical protein